MLTENDVVNYACDYLVNIGYTIVQQLHTSEHGVDIIAQRDGIRCLIEAKGETSASEHTRRYGLAFSRNQVITHVAKALYAITRLMNNTTDKSTIYGMAFPDNIHHIEAVNAIRNALDKLDIKILWVDESGKVTSNI